MKTYYTDRSRQEQQDRCARARWHAYHDGGRGMVLARRPLPLAVGGAVHAGLAALLRDGQDYIDKHLGSSSRVWQVIEDTDRKSTRLNSSHLRASRMPSSA